MSVKRRDPSNLPKARADRDKPQPLRLTSMYVEWVGTGRSPRYLVLSFSFATAVDVDVDVDVDVGVGLGVGVGVGVGCDMVKETDTFCI